VPLTSRIHEGVVFSNRARRTLSDQFAPLLLTVVAEREQGVRVVVAAYYASRKVRCPLLMVGHQVLTRVRCNAVAYSPALPPSQRRRGRPRVYGQKVRLQELGSRHRKQCHSAPSPVSGESQGRLRYFALDLLWRPVGQLVRFVLVDHPRRGRVIWRSTDRAMTPLQIVAGYRYRVKLAVAFKQALDTLGPSAYHFWLKPMCPLSRRSGNPYLPRHSPSYRRQGRRKLEAYPRYVHLGCLAQGLLQYLALSFRAELWRSCRSW